ncbi:MAG: glucosaminidase domain-containing protein [Saprospiraceae bacterium]
MRLHLILSAMLLSLATYADNSITETDKQFFIDTYAGAAIFEMKFAGIPASITLAQAILESGWGRGTVAEGANNYFCIKCFNGWDGPTYDAKDDEPGLSCFRKYQSVAQSFRDHSLFLKEGQRYQPLFQLDRTDFRGWARGLKECGYATDGAYGERLIQIIEEHGLWLFDYAIPEDHFDVLDTPAMPDEEVAHEEPMPAQEQTTAAPDFSTPENEPVLTLPFYRVESEIAPIEEPLKEAHSPMNMDGNRKKRIRPIIPYPSFSLERVD